MDYPKSSVPSLFVDKCVLHFCQVIPKEKLKESDSPHLPVAISHILEVIQDEKERISFQRRSITLEKVFGRIKNTERITLAWILHDVVRGLASDFCNKPRPFPVIRTFLSLSIDNTSTSHQDQSKWRWVLVSN